MFWPGLIVTGPNLYFTCWTRGAAVATAGRASNASTTAARIRGSTALTLVGLRNRAMVYVAVRMRRVWTLLVVLTALMAGATSALAHPERATEFPDASKGSVPKYQHTRARR